MAHITATHDTGPAPFEGERTATLRALPAGALVTRATARLEPLGGPDFGQDVVFGPQAGAVSQGTFGSVAMYGAHAAEIRFHARRTLARISGIRLAGGHLLVDLGSGPIPVGPDGGLGTQGTYPVGDGDTVLPGLTVTGLRVAQTGQALPVVNTVRVTSPPSDVSLALGTGPALFSRSGPLTTPADVPDFAALLGAAPLGAAPPGSPPGGAPPGTVVPNGVLPLPFTLRSSAPCRLLLRLDIEYTLSAGALPEGMDRVRLVFGYEGRPEGSPGLRLELPESARVVSAAGRLRGALEPTAVAGGTGSPDEVPPSLLRVTPGSPYAQPVTLADPAQPTAIDLRLARLPGPPCDLRVDVFPDAGGRPGRASLLPGPAALLVPDTHPMVPAWLSVPLTGAVRLERGERYWVALLPVAGAVDWAARPAPDGDPAARVTRDGGLSWRPADGVPAAELRLRYTPDAFAVPVCLEVRTASGPAVSRIPLHRFAARGGIDIGLDFADIVSGIATAAAATSSPRGELLDDTAVREWRRDGDGVTVSARGADPVHSCVAPCPDGRRFAALRADEPGGVSLALVGPAAPDAPSRTIEVSSFGLPAAVAVHPSGAFAAVAVRVSGAAGDSGDAVVRLVSLTGRAAPPDRPFGGFADLAFSPDGRCLYVLHAVPGVERPPAGRVARIDLNTWCTSARAAESGAGADLAGVPVRLAVAATGTVWALTVEATGADAGRVYRLPADLSGAAASVAVAGGPYDLAVVLGRAAVPGSAALTLVGEDLVCAELLLPPAVRTRFAVRTTAADPLLARVLLARPGALVVVDTAAGTAVRTRVRTGAPAGLAVAPTGGQAMLAADDGLTGLRIGTLLPQVWTLVAGSAAPMCLPDGRAATALGVPGAAGSSVLAQVVAIAPGRRYRLAVDAAATREGAVAAVRWLDEQGAALGAADLPVPLAVGRTDGHPGSTDPARLAVTAPPTARQAEIRITTADGDGLITVASVSFGAVADALAGPGGWSPTGGAVAVPASGGFPAEVTAAGPGTTAALEQTVPVEAGDRFVLRLRTKDAAPGTSAGVGVTWADESGSPVGGEVALPVAAEDFDLATAAGAVPGGATTALIALRIGPGGSLAVQELSFETAAVHPVELRFLSEAPGELTVSGLSVEYDVPEARRAAPPPGGLARPEQEPGRPRNTAAPGGGRTPAGAARLRWSGPRAADRFPGCAPVTGITGIGPARSRWLREALHVETLAQLAAASPADIARVCRAGTGTAESWVRQAASGRSEGDAARAADRVGGSGS